MPRLVLCLCLGCSTSLSWPFGAIRLESFRRSAGELAMSSDAAEGVGIRRKVRYSSRIASGHFTALTECHDSFKAWLLTQCSFEPVAASSCLSLVCSCFEYWLGGCLSAGFCPHYHFWSEWATSSTFSSADWRQSYACKLPVT